MRSATAAGSGAPIAQDVRWRIMAVFSLQGVVPAMLNMRLPDLQIRANLSEAGLGLVWVVGLSAVAGFACGFINPVLGAVLYERIPAGLTGRVTALEGAICWSLLPLGGLLGGLLVGATGLTTALLLVGAAYLVVTLSPLAVPAWRTIDDTRPGKVAASASSSDAPTARVG